MTDLKLKAIMTILVPQVIVLIAENQHINEINASKMFYASRSYSLLEQEETKIWHLSPLSIFTMVDEEFRTGKYVIPEED